jgi:DNA-binding NtrC family response regulator
MLVVTADAAGRPRKLRLRLAGLRAVAGPHKGTTFRIAGAPTVIGTSDCCDIVLRDRTVSARHAEIALRADGYFLTDLGSHNGTLANGLRVGQVFLAPGVVLGLGHTLLEVVDLDEVTEVRLSEAERFCGAIGRSAAMRQVFAVLEAAARSDATVLLQGETGTGKEVLAEALHCASAHADGPLVVFDCGAVPAQLVESELFGHERGAFTGADAPRAGVLERAHGGTLFLDEIGELPLELQPKLLRAVETRRFRRLGSQHERVVDVRLVAATSRNLEHEVAQGRFRQDLYYRLAVVRVRVPPLRERREDVPLLVEHFAARLDSPRLAERLGSLLPLLQSYGWPGNVRELRNVVERLAVLPLEEALPSAVLRPRGRARPQPYTAARERAVDDFERGYVELILEHTGGNVTHAAELAGVSRRYVTMLMTKHGIARLPESG